MKLEKVLSVKDQVKELAHAYGWFDVVSKNPWMVSFKHPEDNNIRLNVYHTVMTITVQWNGECETYKRQTLSSFEDILIKLQD